MASRSTSRFSATRRREGSCAPRRILGKNYWFDFIGRAAEDGGNWCGGRRRRLRTKESMLAGDSFLRGKDAKTTTEMMWAGNPAKENRPWTKGSVGMEERARAQLAFFDTLRAADLKSVRVRTVQ